MFSLRVLCHGWCDVQVCVDRGSDHIDKKSQGAYLALGMIASMSRAAGKVELALIRRRTFELLGLSGLAITQPLLDLLTRNTSIVSSRSISGLEMIVLCLGIVVGPPLIAMSVEVAIGLVSSLAAKVVHWIWTATFLALIVMQVVKYNANIAPVLLAVSSVSIAMLLALLIARFEHIRSAVRLVAIAQVVFVVVALAFSPLSSVVFRGEVSAIRVRVERPHRVVMLVMDEFPLGSLVRSDGSGLIDDDLFPNFAALASTSHWYRNETTVSPLTSDSVPALLSGKYPKTIQSRPTIANHPENLFTALGNTYSLNVHEAVTVLCVLPKCEGSSDPETLTSSIRKVGGALRDVGKLWWPYAKAQRPSPEVDITLLVEQAKFQPIESAWRFIASIEPSSVPRLDFLHVLLPHAPWRYLKDGSTTDNVAPNPGWSRVWLSDWAGLSAYQRHLMQLQATDTLLGQLMDRLRAIKAFDDSLIVVTADHGVAFETGEPNRGMSKKNAAHIAWTPLFIKYPNDTRGVVDDRRAQSIDILPTMAASLGVRLPWKMDGRSLLEPPAPEAPRRVFDFKLNTWHPDKGKLYVELDPARVSEVLGGVPNGKVGDPLRLFRMLPHSEIVGLPLADIPTGLPANFTARIRDSARYRSIKLNTGKVPWIDISGVTAGLSVDSYLGIAVNGIVSAVIRVSPDAKNPQHAKWWGRLLPDAMRNGSNQLEMFEVQIRDGEIQRGALKTP